MTSSSIATYGMVKQEIGYVRWSEKLDQVTWAEFVELKSAVALLKKLDCHEAGAETTNAYRESIDEVLNILVTVKGVTTFIKLLVHSITD